MEPCEPTPWTVTFSESAADRTGPGAVARVPAGVHDPVRFRGVRQACGLSNGQGVQIGAGHDHGAASVRQDAHHPGAADVLHRETEGFERCRHKFRCGVFLEA